MENRSRVREGCVLISHLATESLLVIIHSVSSFLFLHNKEITRCVCTQSVRPL